MAKASSRKAVNEDFDEEVFVDPVVTTWFSTGCTNLDLALSGGWPNGRVINLVGDSSTGKTLLAFEACANLAMQEDRGLIRYAECEAALLLQHAHDMGFPQSGEIKRGLITVEDFHRDITRFLKRCDPDKRNLYILDSLDALSDDAEMDRDIEAGSYGAEKAKKMSRLFRMLVQPIAEKNCTLIIISQLRDKIGVMFGEKHTRSGGRALNFYSSIIVWLAEVKKETKTVKGQQRTIGAHGRARVRKNKLGMPHREVPFLVLYGYGVDDETSMLLWLDASNSLDGSAEQYKRRISKARAAQDYEELRVIRRDLRKQTRRAWREIESSVAPQVRKYQHEDA